MNMKAMVWRFYQCFFIENIDLVEFKVLSDEVCLDRKAEMGSNQTCWDSTFRSSRLVGLIQLCSLMPQ